MYSDVRKYPASQRYYTITTDPGRGDRPGADIFTGSTSDGVNGVGIEGTVQFTLDTRPGEAEGLRQQVRHAHLPGRRVARREAPVGWRHRLVGVPRFGLPADPRQLAARRATAVLLHRPCTRVCVHQGRLRRRRQGERQPGEDPGRDLGRATAGSRRGDGRALHQGRHLPYLEGGPPHGVSEKIDQPTPPRPVSPSSTTSPSSRFSRPRARRTPTSRRPRASGRSTGRTRTHPRRHGSTQSRLCPRGSEVSRRQR
jgi:hypothetical protein